ncbi:hypothetical protein ACIQCR_03960 [Streptomyces sp. NPDC093249]
MADKGTPGGDGSGERRKPDPPLSQGTPPPGNSDGKVPASPPPSGKRRR